MSFFIKTSQGVINRDQITRCCFLKGAIEFHLSDGQSFYLKGAEAYHFYHALTPNYGIGLPPYYQEFIANYAPALEDTGFKVTDAVTRIKESHK